MRALLTFENRFFQGPDGIGSGLDPASAASAGYPAAEQRLHPASEVNFSPV